mgnify:CR=1 FL=1
MNREHESVLLRVLLGPLVACLQLFALYVTMHGHYSPGGGFQGGVLLGASLVLPLLVRVEGRGFVRVSERGAMIMASLGVLLYVAIGCGGLLMGRDFLDYSALPLEVSSSARQSLGILGIEAGVMCCVAGVIVSLYYALFAGADAGEVRS